MTKDQAKLKAMDLVFLRMTREDFETACRDRGIRISSDHSRARRKLIEALSYEWATEL